MKAEVVVGALLASPKVYMFVVRLAHVLGRRFAEEF